MPQPTIETLYELVQALTQRIEDRDREAAQDRQDMLAELVRMSRAFPEGDVDGHRMAHQQMIEDGKAQREFWLTMKKEAGKWGLVLILGFLVVAVKDYVIDHISAALLLLKG